MRASRSLYVALTGLISPVNTITAFLVSPTLQRQPFYGVYPWQSSFIFPTNSRCQPRLYFREMDSTDAFQVLNIDTSANKKEIKLAYKRMAFRYHPDVVTNQNTPPEQKRRANDIFAKINWAYAQLSEKDGPTSSTTSSSTSTSTSTSSSSSPYECTPPHRRTSRSSTRNPNQASSRWTSYPYSPGANPYSTSRYPNQASRRTTTYPYSPGATSYSSTGGTFSNPNQAYSRSTTYPFSSGAAHYPSTRGTYSNGNTASSPSSFSSTSYSEKDAWIHEEFGSKYRGRGSDTRSTASSSQRQSYSLYTTPPSPPRQESTTSGTDRNGSTFHYGKTPSRREQQLENDGYQTADINWTVRLKDDQADDTLSLAEKEILKTATWVFKFTFRQRAHFIASRMLDEYLQNPDRDQSSPPVPNPENPAEAVALKLVEFAPSSERKQTISTRTAEQQMDEQSRIFLNNTPLGKSADVKGKGNNVSFVSNVTQTVSTRTAEQQMDDEKEPVIDYKKAEASFLQSQDGKLDQGMMEKLAGCTDVEEKPRSLDVFHEKTKKEEQDKLRSATCAAANLLSVSHASNRKKRVATTKNKNVKANRRVVWLTRHIRVLETHKKKLPTGYYEAKNWKGNVLGSLCSVFSAPAKMKDGTTNKADDKRLAIQKELGEENPKRVFDDTLMDLKQELVSEMITDYGCAE
jgi:ribosomal protein L23